MRVWIGIGVFVAVILIAFALFVLHITGSPRAVAPEVGTNLAPITAISITDTYGSKTGVHTISGSATVPTACTALTATSSITVAGDASSSPIIRVDLSAPVDVGTCLELPTVKSFSLLVHAAKSSSVVVYANGALASTTVK